MKLKLQVDYSAFFAVVQKCECPVYFDTAEGDHLNLKSVLSQYVFCTKIQHTHKEKEGFLVFDPVDLPLLAPWLKAQTNDKNPEEKPVSDP